LAGIHLSLAQGVKSILDKEVNPGEVLMEFDDRDKEIIGNYYIHENWQKGNIVLKSGTEIKNQLIRFDLEYDLLEVKLSDNLKVVPLRKLNYYRIIDQAASNIFQNCDVYSFNDGTSLSGICQVLEDEYYGAIIKYTYNIREATYVPALDMGKKDDEVIIKEYPFLTKDKIIYKIPGRKKDFYAFFINPDVDIKSYMREQGLNYKNKDDLIKILQYVNEKIKP
jgi:hypothetical protein